MRQLHYPLVIFLMGPTGSGKTQLAVELVQQLPCDIISVDSAMIYRGMDIGTAKPDLAILKIAPHRLIDILDPSEIYSVAQFRTDALREITASLAKGRIPLLVGGTMMYFRALQQGLSYLPSADATVREKLLAEAKILGWEALHARLESIDPEAAKRIHPNDPQRLQRALEVYELTGQTITALQAQTGQGLPYHVLPVAIAPLERDVLHKRIQERFNRMLEQGFLEEVTRLLARGDLHPDLPAMRAVGYRQVIDHLAGLTDYETMREKGIIATRQLAKRQLTWLRSWGQSQWFDSQDTMLLKHMLEHVKNVTE